MSRTMPIVLWMLMLVLVLVWSGRGLDAPALADVPDRPPNIVLVLADDLGWRDLACQGSDLHETPNLDRLASEGMRFTHASAMSVCSPTRAAILTGKHPARLGITIWREGSFPSPTAAARPNRALIDADSAHDLPRSEQTLAELLRSKNYRTLHVGKWHVGDADHSPESHGFEINLGGTHWGAPESHFWPFRGERGFREYRYVPGLGLGRPGQYLTDRLTDVALKLIEEVKDQPFFLNLWHHAPHTPIEGKPELVEHYRGKLRPGLTHRNPDYAAMIHSLDESVGRVLARLSQLGLAERTVVVFTSDNGGYNNENRGRIVTSNAPLRSGKGSLYEGGVRVPLLIRWPGKIPANTECGVPVTCMDLFRTIAELAAVDGSTGVDGVSFVPLLKQAGASLPSRDLFFHYPHYYPTTSPVSAIRSGDWKLLEYLEDSRVELYDLARDPGEENNLAGERPELAESLVRKLRAWRIEVNARMPRPRARGN